jgi:hypothetical protein
MRFNRHTGGMQLGTCSLLQAARPSNQCGQPPCSILPPPPCCPHLTGSEDLEPPAASRKGRKKKTDTAAAEDAAAAAAAAGSEEAALGTWLDQGASPEEDRRRFPYHRCA